MVYCLALSRRGCGKKLKWWPELGQNMKKRKQNCRRQAEEGHYLKQCTKMMSLWCIFCFQFFLKLKHETTSFCLVDSILFNWNFIFLHWFLNFDTFLNLILDFIFIFFYQFQPFS